MNYIYIRPRTMNYIYTSKDYELYIYIQGRGTIYISRKGCIETDKHKYTLSLCVSSIYIGVNYCQEIDIFKKP